MPKIRAQLVVDVDLLQTDMLALLEAFADEQVFWPEFSDLADGIRQGRLESAQIDELCERIDIMFDRACTSHDCT